MVSRRLILAPLAGLLLCLPAAAHAQSTFTERTRDLAFSVGYIFEGSAYFAEPNRNSAHSAGLMVRTFYDKYVAEQFAVGVFAQSAFTDFPRYTTDSGALMIEGGFSFKARFLANEKVALKPGFNLGYRHYFADDDFVAGGGLGLNVGLEAQYDYGAPWLPYLELGFISQPTGGNDSTDITYDPIVYIQIGLAF